MKNGSVIGVVSEIRQITPSLPFSQSFLLFSHSFFLNSLIAPLHVHPSFIPVFHSLIAFCLYGINEVLLLQMHHTVPLHPPHTPPTHSALRQLEMCI